MLYEVITPLDLAQKARVALLAKRQHHGIGAQRFEFAGRFRAAIFVECHLLDRQVAARDLLDRAEPADLDALFNRLVGLDRITSYNVCYTKLLRAGVAVLIALSVLPATGLARGVRNNFV